jgi:hypothetical protein
VWCSLGFFRRLQVRAGSRRDEKQGAWCEAERMYERLDPWDEVGDQLAVEELAGGASISRVLLVTYMIAPLSASFTGYWSGKHVLRQLQFQRELS